MTQTERELLEALKASSNYVDTLGGNSIRYRQVIAKAEQAERVEPVLDEHQAFIDSLPLEGEDKMFEQIDYWARQSYARYKSSVRGQQITAADSVDSHLIWAALRWAKENRTPPAAAVSEPTCIYCDGTGDVHSIVGEWKGRCHCAAAVSEPWQPIDSAPKDGTELIGWRDDCGPLLIRWTSFSELMTDLEIEQSGIDEETLFAEDWFYADIVRSGRLEGSEIPTHWMPLPPAPSGVNE